MFKNGQIAQYMKPLALGAAAYMVYRWFSGRQNAAGFGAEGDAIYDRLNDLRNKIEQTTKRYEELQGQSNDLDIQIAQTASEYDAAKTGKEKLAIRASVVDMMRSRDKAMLEMGLLGRLLTSLREQIIAEDARLRSAVVAPDIAIRRSQGLGAEEGGLYIAPPTGTLPIPIPPGWKDYKLPPEDHEKRRAWKKAHDHLKKAKRDLEWAKREYHRRRVGGVR
jgi:hypothetical protein